MASTEWPELIRQFADGTISRRDFVARAFAYGVSAGAVATVLSGATPAVTAAQDAGEPILPDGYVGPLIAAKEPLSAEPVTLRIVVPQEDNAGDWANNSFTAWYEERTNVHIEWQEVAATCRTPSWESRTGAGLRPPSCSSTAPRASSSHSTT